MLLALLRGVRRGGVQSAAAQTTAAHTFRVFVRGVDTGIEEVTVLESADGWTLRGSGKLRAPVNLVDGLLGGAVRPRVEADRAHDQPHREREAVDASTPRSAARSRRATSRRTGRISAARSTVAADTVVLPNLIFGAYEALAARLATEKVGVAAAGVHRAAGCPVRRSSTT